MKNHEYHNDIVKNKFEPRQDFLDVLTFIVSKELGIKHCSFIFDEKIKVLRAQEGFTEVKKTYLFKFIKIKTSFSVKLSPTNPAWLYVLFHELTHIIVFDKHGLHKHSKEFYKIQSWLLSNYYAKFVQIYNEIILSEKQLTPEGRKELEAFKEAYNKFI